MGVTRIINAAKQPTNAARQRRWSAQAGVRSSSQTQNTHRNAPDGTIIVTTRTQQQFKTYVNLDKFASTNWTWAKPGDHRMRKWWSNERASVAHSDIINSNPPIRGSGRVNIGRTMTWPWLGVKSMLSMSWCWLGGQTSHTLSYIHSAQIIYVRVNAVIFCAPRGLDNNLCQN